MDINQAAEAIDGFLHTYEGKGGRNAVEVRTRPSGDDMDHIKVWVNLGPAAQADDLHAWCAAAEQAIRKAFGEELKAWKLEVRADAI